MMWCVCTESIRVRELNQKSEPLRMGVGWGWGLGGGRGGCLKGLVRAALRKHSQSDEQG